MNSPLIISCAVIGAELTKEVYPHLPLTPDEIAIESEKAVNAGASIIHLHVRDKKGNPSQEVEIFKEVTEKIKKRCDCIIQYSTGGAVGTPLEKRYEPLQLKPEMATLSMGTMNFGSEIYENSENTIKTISKEIQKNGVMAELEIFDFGMMEATDRLLKKGFLPEKFHMDFVLGVPGGMSGSLKNLMILLDCLNENQSWRVDGSGK